MPVGVPFDDDAKQALCVLIADGKSPRTAAAELGFSFDSTVKRHLSEDPKFFAAFTEANEQASAQIEDVLYQEAAGGNLGAIKMWLYNRNPSRWRDETVLRKEITGPDGGPVQIVQAGVMALREVLTDADTRQGALTMVRELPALGDGGTTPEDGDPGPSGADRHR